jgi:hypothetical protein
MIRRPWPGNINRIVGIGVLISPLLNLILKNGRPRSAWHVIIVCTRRIVKMTVMIVVIIRSREAVIIIIEKW